MKKTFSASIITLISYMPAKANVKQTTELDGLG